MRLRLNPFDFSVDREMVISALFVIIPGLIINLRSEDEVVWLWHLLVFGSQHDKNGGGR